MSEMDQARAMQIMGLRQVSSAEDLKKAYQAAIASNHPDSCETPTHSIDDIKRAYALLENVLVRATLIRIQVPLRTIYNGGHHPIEVNGRKGSLLIPDYSYPGKILVVENALSEGRDLRFLVDVLPDPVFDVRGIDIGLEIEVPYSDVTLRTKIPLPDGQTTTIYIEPGVPSGGVINVQNFGFLGGDLHVFVRRNGRLDFPMAAPMNALDVIFGKNRR